MRSPAARDSSGAGQSCLAVSVQRMTSRTTYDLTVAAAATLAGIIQPGSACPSACTSAGACFASLPSCRPSHPKARNDEIRPRRFRCWIQLRNLEARLLRHLRTGASTAGVRRKGPLDKCLIAMRTHGAISTFIGLSRVQRGDGPRGRLHPGSSPCNTPRPDVRDHGEPHGAALPSSACSLGPRVAIHMSCSPSPPRACESGLKIRVSAVRFCPWPLQQDNDLDRLAFSGAEGTRG